MYLQLFSDLTNAGFGKSWEMVERSAKFLPADPDIRFGDREVFCARCVKILHPPHRTYPRLPRHHPKTEGRFRCRYPSARGCMIRWSSTTRAGLDSLRRCGVRRATRSSNKGSRSWKI